MKYMHVLIHEIYYYIEDRVWEMLQLEVQLIIQQQEIGISIKPRLI